VILVYGDVMIDFYIHGKIRESQESPAPIFMPFASMVMPGGAANVAMNVAALGQDATLIAAIGKDDSGASLNKTLAMTERITPCLVSCEGRVTTVKQRMLVNGGQVFRMDIERTEALSEAAEMLILAEIAKADEPDAVVVSDYAKGGVTPAVAKAVIEEARKRSIPSVVDTKTPMAPCWKRATLIKPNLKEIGEALHHSPPSNEFEAAAAAMALREATEIDHVLLTCGANGMMLADGNGALSIPPLEIDAVDVVGAGDTVAAAMAVLLGSGQSVMEAALFANAAGAVAVSRAGTAAVTLDEVKAIADRHAGNAGKKGRAVEREESLHRLH
jgi:D-beta-D-heptose 7-phosphate kinase/D-beta-D-heptose 1-phosphate adenosyltransferase